MLGEHPDLRADMSVTNDPQRLAARLIGMRGALFPAAAMLHGILVRNAAQQHDDFAQHKLGDAARIGKRRVENGYAKTRSRR